MKNFNLEELNGILTYVKEERNRPKQITNWDVLYCHLKGGKTANSEVQVYINPCLQK